ncbi:hypothetical protein RINTHM_12800 [Richelia intracellularis HM01]|nr:hypothetical protein RINTHM_12800 [Richelia intracellularis HM01]
MASLPKENKLYLSLKSISNIHEISQKSLSVLYILGKYSPMKN